MTVHLAGARVIIIGAGVAGACAAVTLQESGARCVLIDPSPIGENASGIAAGMLAPAFESALDPASRGGFELLREARDLWPSMVGEGLLHRAGAIWIGDERSLRLTEGALRREGAVAERLSTTEARSLAPMLRAVQGAVFTPEDWRLETGAALRLLETRFYQAGGELLRARVHDVEPFAASTANGRLEADAVILCAGWESRAWSAVAPELASLEPVKGERVRFPSAPLEGAPIIRTAAGYVSPSAEGAVAGATMISGVADRRTTRASDAFAGLARELFPRLEHAPYEAAAGVRAATPDGLPLVGRSRSGLWLSTGFRRNGWTLAPLAARLIAATLAGADPGRWAEALRPDRVLVS